ncbi:MAG: hypothetical protein AB7U75_03820 [Hyphomicrobiaceae bacterium]
MNGLPENIEELLTELVEKSRHEMNIMLALADAIRRTDEQLLREVQNVTLHHEIRRAEIKGELQALASRLCTLPGRATAEHPTDHLQRPHQAIPDAMHREHPADRRNGWKNSAEDIDAELNDAFGAELQRH